MADGIRVLYIDNEPRFADTVAQELEREDQRIEVTTETAASDGLARLTPTEIDCIVSEYQLPTMDGLEFLSAVREQSPNLPFILFTGTGSEAVASDAFTAGATDYVQKEPGPEQYTLLANRITTAVAQNRTQQEIETTRTFYGTLLQHASDFLMTVDDTGAIEYISPAVERVMGYPVEEFGEVDAFEFVHPDDIDIAAEAFTTVLDNPGEEHAVTYRAQHADGSWRWLEVRGRNLFDDPTVEAIIVTARDITERKERQQEALRNERRFKALFDDPQLLIGLLDTDGTLLDGNATAMEYVDVELEDVLGMKFWRTPWWSDDLRPVVREKVEQAASGEYVPYEADLTDHEGDPYSVFGVIRPVRDNTGDVTTLVVSARDITDRVKREQQLGAMDRMLRHNVHNEMSIILGAAETIAARIGDDVIEFVEMIQESGRELLAITDKQRDIVEVVSEEPEVRPVSIGREVQNAIAVVASQYPAAEIVLTDTENARVQAVPQIARAVEELIENAVLHAASGSPTVEVSVTATPTPVRIRVADSNPLIPEPERAILRGEGERGPLFHGSGMGLLLVNWIVSACDGRTTYEERPPTGNQVTIELPTSGPDGEGRVGQSTD